MKKLNTYSLFIVTILIIIGLYIADATTGKKAFDITMGSFGEMLKILPAIFILLGLLDVWVPREVMVKYVGEHSGAKGIILSFILGSFAAGPLYAAFPIAAVLLKKGAKFSNILIFLGAWSTTKVPMLMFEIASLGLKFGLTRLVVDIIGIILMAKLIAQTMDGEEVEVIVERVKALDH